jgi:hypothetical protein
MFRSFKVCASIAFVAGAVMPAAQADEKYGVVAIVQLPAGSKPLTSTDIAWVDADSHAYALTDRSNKSVDVINTRSNKKIRLLTANPPFAGASVSAGGTVAVPQAGGPNGVIIIERKDDVWAADGPVCPPGDSNPADCTKSGSLKVISLKSGKTKKVIYVPSEKPGHGRVDELCYNPASDVVLAGSNSFNAFGDRFLSFIDEDSGDIVGTITLDGKDPNAKDPDTGQMITAVGGGIEQCQANPRDGKFYLALPDIGGGSGAVLRISGKKPFKVEKVIHINSSTGCAGPAGLTIGSDHQMLVGCNGNSTNSVILYDDGRLPIYVQMANGVDEVWFDPGSNHYYLQQQNAVPTAVMDVEDAGHGKTLPHPDPRVDTATASKNPAADPDRNLVYLPVLAVLAPGGTSICSKFGGNAQQGCIAIYTAKLDADDCLGGDGGDEQESKSCKHEGN